MEREEEARRRRLDLQRLRRRLQVLRRRQRRRVRPLAQGEYDAGVYESGGVLYQVGGRRKSNGTDLEIARLRKNAQLLLSNPVTSQRNGIILTRLWASVIDISSLWVE